MDTKGRFQDFFANIENGFTDGVELFRDRHR